MKIAVMGAPGSGTAQLATGLAAHFQSHPAPAFRAWIEACPPLLAALCDPQKPVNDQRIEAALLAHGVFDLTLVCGLDSAPGTHPHRAISGTSPEALDTALRSLLTLNKMAFAVVYGEGRAQLASALRAISASQHHKAQAGQDKPAGHWHWSCENCSDPACERAVFTGLLKNPEQG